MTSYRIRPRFKRLTPLSIVEVCQNVEEHLQTSEVCEGSVTSKLIILKIPPTEQHF